MGNLVRYTCQDDGMAFLTLANSPVNTLSQNMLNEFLEVVENIENDPAVRVLIISSNQRYFCVGLDLKEQSGFKAEQSVESVQKIQNCFDKIATLPIPVICAVNGAALGGGAELAISGDFRILEESAIIGFPETGLGIIPGAGGTQRLPRLVGVSKAKYWIFTGNQFSSEEAMEDGVADFIVDDGILLESAIELADEILSSGPLAVKAAKNAIEKGMGLPMKDALDLEISSFQKLVNTKDWNEGLKAFLAKRKANWQGE
ncbi:MAG: enoyl-CoA hydratase [Candidatus Marinimicrobia bacterium]|jgi:enoyl-CoA hydratase/carnithine racemase|nr:enoyl-CoA hydratase [Candidatus Neomarinimicrobiota bacterium]MBT3634431.1 enoyl-CoA hydratase [Candidatus Neomarinimicrobiota bacterium]MBT3683258.1 enoyl-CoA hydratase [Candidatus Neomarinimicrobiota bacterium]MBT3760146.1 enoyl-CoA hydratase [Candidatus Neomarinimicrobiota bacterium]MBT3896241.1 enoyl-CoA hydratase [Candidatus Neomarinimicrobiota bacterium]